MKKLIYLTIIATSGLLASCSKTTSPQWMAYYETTCIPQWTDLDSDRRTKNRLEDFLKREGIVPLKIRIEGERVPTCEFCDCSTGKIYYVQVDESQIEFIQFFGFVEK